MKLRFIFMVLFLQACNQQNSTNAQLRSHTEIDTNLLKNVKWQFLNDFVAYHVLNEGINTSNAGVFYKLIPIASYNYNDNAYIVGQDTAINCSLAEIKELLLCDTFPNKNNFDCIVRINSEIAYKLQPYLLETVFVRPRKNDAESLSLLLKKLKKERFVEKVIVKNNDSNITVPIINVKIKPHFTTLSEINKICNQLKSMNNIEDAFITDFFTNQNKQNLFYRVTSR